MNTKKLIQIFTIVAAVAQLLVLLIEVVLTAARQKVMLLYGTDLIARNAVPWAQIGVAAGALVIAVAFVVLAMMVRADNLKWVSVGVLIFTVLNQVAGYVLPIVSNRMYAMYGASTLAAYSALVSTLGMITSPFSLVHTAFMFMACGICFVVKEKELY